MRIVGLDRQVLIDSRGTVVARKWTKCVQSLPRRSIPDYAKNSKHLAVILVPLLERGWCLRGNLGGPRRQAPTRANLEA